MEGREAGGAYGIVTQRGWLFGLELCGMELHWLPW